MYIYIYNYITIIYRTYKNLSHQKSLHPWSELPWNRRVRTPLDTPHWHGPWVSSASSKWWRRKGGFHGYISSLGTYLIEWMVIPGSWNGGTEPTFKMLDISRFKFGFMNQLRTGGTTLYGKCVVKPVRQINLSSRYFCHFPRKNRI